MTDNSGKGAPITSNTAAPQTGPGQSQVRGRWSPARWAYSFYAVAASGAVIGQSWVALDHLPWPPQVPVAVRVLAVLPFALCLELLAMALAAMADERMRLGERAYGLRVFSTGVAVVAVGIQVAGHWPDLYWSSVFGVLSGSAYALWLLHAAARRRDALRAAGKLATTAPDYGLWRRVRHPIFTARAAEAAREGDTDADTGQGFELSPVGGGQDDLACASDGHGRPSRSDLGSGRGRECRACAVAGHRHAAGQDVIHARDSRVDQDLSGAAAA